MLDRRGLINPDRPGGESAKVLTFETRVMECDLRPVDQLAILARLIFVFREVANQLGREHGGGPGPIAAE